MPITVAIIEEKVFKTKVRGYDPVEVDNFLDEICDEMVILQDEIANLQARLAQASRQQAYAAPAAQRPAADTSDSAQKMLARAQRIYDDTIADAQREAAEIIANAKSQVRDAETLSLTSQRDELKQQISDLRAQIVTYRNKLMELMQEQRDMLDKLGTI